VLEDSGGGLYKVTMGGHANRNQLGFEEKFKRIVADLDGSAEKEGENDD
jgi:hypothetical protein